MVFKTLKSKKSFLWRHRFCTLCQCYKMLQLAPHTMHLTYFWNLKCWEGQGNPRKVLIPTGNLLKTPIFSRSTYFGACPWEIRKSSCQKGASYVYQRNLIYPYDIFNHIAHFYDREHLLRKYASNLFSHCFLYGIMKRNVFCKTGSRY